MTLSSLQNKTSTANFRNKDLKVSHKIRFPLQKVHFFTQSVRSSLQTLQQKVQGKVCTEIEIVVCKNRLSVLCYQSW